jgi:hypothetical protein
MGSPFPFSAQSAFSRSAYAAGLLVAMGAFSALPLWAQSPTEGDLNTLYYRRQVTAEEVETILQTHAEGTSLRGVSRVSHRAYGTVVSLLRAASEKSQLVHNQAIQAGDTDEIVADEMWAFVQKNKNTAGPRSY